MSIQLIDGKVNIASIEELTQEDLSSWINSRLHGRDRFVPQDMRQGALAFSRIASIYTDLSLRARNDINRIVSDFIREMARDENSNWNGESAHELLMLAQSIFSSNDYQQYEIVARLLEMADNPRFLAFSDIPLPEDIHFRILQTLVSLRWRSSLDFWMRQVALASDKYAGVAFNGAALISPKDALILLSNLPGSDAVKSQILRTLPYFILRFGVDTLIPLFRLYLPEMPRSLRDSISAYLAEEGIVFKAMTLPTHEIFDFDELTLKLGGPNSLRKQCSALVTPEKIAA